MQDNNGNGNENGNENENENENLEMEDLDTDNIHSKNILNAKWTSYYEEIFANWCDNAMCYRYLHNNCNRYYHYMHILFTIPVIGISTLTGVANFAQDRIPPENQVMYTMIIGAFNILAGFISTVSQFLKINELNESHRVSSISWAKLHRNIKIELIKKPTEREPVYNYLKKMKEQYDLLIEISPEIPSKEILRFNKKFKGHTFFKPEICGELVSVRDTMYKRDANSEEDFQTVITIRNKRDSIMKNVEIENFVKKFLTEHKRKPSIDEIYDNLTEDIGKDHIDKYMSGYSSKNLLSPFNKVKPSLSGIVSSVKSSRMPNIKIGKV